MKNLDDLIAAINEAFPPRTLIVHPSKEAETRDAVEQLRRPNLDVITSRHVPTDAAYMLNREAMERPMFVDFKLSTTSPGGAPAPDASCAVERGADAPTSPGASAEQTATKETP